MIHLLALTLAAVGPTRPAVRPTMALDDPTIVAIFDAANSYDMEASELAKTRASSPDVRNFADMLYKAHMDARAQGRALAKKLGVTPTPPATNPLQADHVAAMKKLRALKGRDFDRAFVETELAYHNAVIGAVQTTLFPAIKNQELKDFVTKVSPVFVQHQMAAKDLLAKLPK